jgi:hypothetical protein
MDETPCRDRSTRRVSAAPSLETDARAEQKSGLNAFDRALHDRSMSRWWIALMTVLALGSASACGEQRDRCRDATTSAANAWSAYVAALERARTEALISQREARSRLNGDLKSRFDATAQERADRQAARGSDAWSRAYRDAYDDACTRDDECRGWKEERDTADAAAADLEARLPRARAALYAVQHDPERARAAARALSPQVDYPHLELAQQLTRALLQACINGGSSQRHAK